MDNSSFEIIKKDLPNFPDEVIKDWIEPYYEKHGWPPKDTWNGVLFNENFEFWKEVEWKKETLDLTSIKFSNEWIEVFSSMCFAYTRKNIDDTFFGRQLGEKGRTRWLSPLFYILETGFFPKPICLLCKNNEFSVVDGNHRFMAWQSLAKINDELGKLSPEDKLKTLKDLKISYSKGDASVNDKVSEFSKTQEVLVAYQKNLTVGNSTTQTL